MGLITLVCQQLGKMSTNTSRCQFVVSRPRLSFLERPKQKTTVFLFEGGHPDKDVICCGLPTIGGGCKFCHVHKCQISSCNEEVRKRSWEQIPSAYCEAHTCHSGDICGKMCPKDSYCDSHRCLLCSQEAIGETCYCRDHLMAIRCNQEECTNYVVLERPLPKFASSYQWCCHHVCQICGVHVGQPENQLCHWCRCNVTGCPHPKDSGSCYCDVHTKTTCQYELGCRGRCQQLVINGSRWCSDHKCSYSTCGHHIFEYDDEDGGYRSHFCRQHDKLNILLQNYRMDLGILLDYKCSDTSPKDHLIQEIKLRAERIAEKSHSSG